MTKYQLSITLLLVVTMLFTACDKEDPVIPNEEELITTLSYTLTPNGGGTPVVFTFKDLDGEGGNAPEVTTGVLAANQTYTGVIELLNETETPAENITEEVEEEGVDHQFFFQSNVIGTSVAYNDQDENGNPLGIASTLTTGNAALGTITITLRHEPKKTASGVADGDITNADGETDIEVIFDVEVE